MRNAWRLQARLVPKSGKAKEGFSLESGDLVKQWGAHTREEPSEGAQMERGPPVQRDNSGRGEGRASISGPASGLQVLLSHLTCVATC